MPQPRKNQKSSSINTTSEELRDLIDEHHLVEKNLIGSILLFPNEFEKCVGIVSSEDFFDQLCSDLYKEFLKIYSEKKQITVINLISKFSASVLTSLMSGASEGQDTRKTAAKVKNNRLVREIIRSSQEQINLTLGKHPIEKIVSLLKESYENTQSSIATASKNDSKTVIEKLKSEKETFSGKKFIGFPTFDNLDQLVDGLIVPHIWIVGGSPGSGKTFFSLQIVERILKNDARVVIFSTENSSIRTMLRLIGCHTGIPEIDILKGNFTPEEGELIKATEEYLKSKVLFIYDDVFDTDDIRLKLYQHVKKDGVNVFVVDYIQLLNTQEDNYEQMRIVSSELQKISKENNCALIAVSQISNEGQKSRSFFGLHFKGAGEIGAIADVAMELKRSTKNFNEVGCMVKKVRHNIPGNIEFTMFTEENRSERSYIKEKFI